MKPYFEDVSTGIVIYHGDCREVLPALNSSVSTMMFTDPPYGVNYDGGTTVRDKLKGDNTFGCYEWLIPRLFCVSYICCPDKALPTIVALADISLRSVIVWRKQAQYGALSAHYKQANEFIAYIVPIGEDSLWCGPTTETTDWFQPRLMRAVHHPTEKPIDLVLRALKNHSADLVIDPFMGSGTTLIAAKMLGRGAVGIELEEKYCEIAAKRLQQDYLFTPEVTKPRPDKSSLFDE